MPDQNNSLQQSGYDQGTAAIAVVHEQLRGITGALSEVKDAVKNQAEQLGKLAVIEERNIVINQALQRAFGEITQTNERLAVVIGRQQEFEGRLQAELQQHKEKITRWTSYVTGAAAALTMVWAVFGYYFSDTAKSVIEITQAYKYGRLPVVPPRAMTSAPAADTENK